MARLDSYLPAVTVNIYDGSAKDDDRRVRRRHRPTAALSRSPSHRRTRAHIRRDRGEPPRAGIDSSSPIIPYPDDDDIRHHTLQNVRCSIFLPLPLSTARPTLICFYLFIDGRVSTPSTSTQSVRTGRENGGSRARRACGGL
jgi:hypothetical protein